MKRRLRLLALTAVLAVGAVGLLVADTLTRPLEVQLDTRIEIYEEDEGSWKKVDEIGPAHLRFDATLLEMARGGQVGTDFVYRTTTRKGRDYSVRLVDPADVSFNPATGRYDGDLVFEVTLGGKSARVVARPTTETRFGPAGTLRGRRAQGALGRGPVTFTVVSVNELDLEGEKPMILVSVEDYRMIPRGD
jgi:hypothetical protein